MEHADDRTSVVVDTTGEHSSVVVLFVDNGQPFWRMEVAGPPKTITRAVGTLGDSFQNVSQGDLTADARFYAGSVWHL
jgi:hypothetical protein